MRYVWVFGAGFVIGFVADAILMIVLMRYVPYVGWDAIEARLRWDRAKNDWRGATLWRAQDHPIEGPHTASSGTSRGDQGEPLEGK